MNKIIIEQADLQTDIPLKFTLTKPLASVMFDGVIVTDPAMAAQLRSAPQVLTRDVLLREQEQEAAARAETELAEAAAAQEAAKREAAEAREAEEVAKQAGAEAKRLAAAHEKEAAEAAQASAAAATAATLAAKERSEADDATRKRKLAQTKYTKEKGEAVEAAKLAAQANLKATLTKCCGGVFLCLVPMLAAYHVPVIGISGSGGAGVEGSGGRTGWGGAGGGYERAECGAQSHLDHESVSVLGMRLVSRCAVCAAHAKAKPGRSVCQLLKARNFVSVP